MTAAGRALNLPLLNICIWVKPNGGMGALYRSRHEFVCVFKAGGESHTNNVELGRFGRNRTNVWQYPGMSSFGSERDELLAAHPTVKPVVMIADAIRDVTKRGDAVLDTFMGSGSTVIAAEETGRTCFGVELDPRYVDVAVHDGKTRPAAMPSRLKQERVLTIWRPLKNSKRGGSPMAR